VDENVATTHLLQENQLGAVVEELDELKWRIAATWRDRTAGRRLSQWRSDASKIRLWRV
jgi:hypothetical protein